MRVTRRGFVLGATALAGGLAVGWYRLARPHPNPLLKHLDPQEVAFNPYVVLDRAGTITVIVPRAEMGQGVSTTLAALVAEELDQPLAGLRVEHGPASPAYYNAALLRAGVPFRPDDQGTTASLARAAAGAAARLLGLQVTGGSSSTVDAFDKMRHAGAAVRSLLLEAAAARLGVAVSELDLAPGAVVHAATGQRIALGSLAADAAAREPPAATAPKPPHAWTQLGRPLARVDVPGKVRGEPGFGIDVALPGMLHATVRMSPVHGARLTGFDDAAARRLPGVVDVLPLGTGIGVLAKDTWSAFRAARAVSVRWSEAPASLANDDPYPVIRRAFDEPGHRLRDDGDVERALAETARIVEAEYRVPYLAHACLEPMNATARVSADGAEIWLGTQAPTLVREHVAEVLGLTPRQVTVHTTWLGGGFGRRGETDAARYAAALARHAAPRPVKLTWTREEDLTHDFYRPAAVGRFRAALAPGGNPIALDARIASQSVTRAMLGRIAPWLPFAGPDRLIVEGCFDQPYAIQSYRVSGHEAQLPVPVGFWRSVGNSYNAFFLETFLDELAAAAGRDPLALRLALTGPWPRASRVLERLGDLSGWQDRPPAPRGAGLAFCASFGSLVGQVVEVTDTPEGIRIDKVYVVIDCGRALDPGIVSAQMESGVIFGLSAAAQAITLNGGRVEQTNFHRFDALRMHQAPEIVVEILRSDAEIGGVGEPGTPPALPALGNAIFAATGRRQRALPFSEAIAPR